MSLDVMAETAISSGEPDFNFCDVFASPFTKSLTTQVSSKYRINKILQIQTNLKCYFLGWQ